MPLNTTNIVNLYGITLTGIAAIFQKLLTLFTFKLFKMATANSNLNMFIFPKFFNIVKSYFTKKFFIKMFVLIHYN